ncbi:MAG: DegT/DnrJ/EryC1/StrS family aminotransferase [Phycisphaerales bacterium]|nr:DegT/DnrJ/EryC1/StrS family aminotransferase [Phycisphaerales bacterium]
MRIAEFTPEIGDAEIARVVGSMKANWLTEGEKTAELEKLLANYFGCRRVVMMPNGTLAIFAALKILGIGEGDEVLVPDFTFFGTASAVVLAGAVPVFVDVDPRDGNMCVRAAEASLSQRTRAVLPVHMYGQAADMAALTAFAARHGLKLIEDAAQGMGVTFGDRHVGTFGEIGCISFFADKTMTTGEGGALIVNRESLIEDCLYFKNQGRLRRGSFVCDRMGYNFRITDVQSAVGLAQFERVEETIRRKRALREQYYELLKHCPGVRLPEENGFGRVVPFRVNIQVDDPAELSRHLEARGVATRRYFYPLHLQPGFKGYQTVMRQRPVNSVALFESGLMLPSGLNLTTQEIEFVCDNIVEFQSEQSCKGRSLAAGV